MVSCALKIARVNLLNYFIELFYRKRFCLLFLERVDFPTRKNVYTKKGILEAAGVCYCDESTSCKCDTNVSPITEKSTELRNMSRYHKPGKIISELLITSQSERYL